MPNIIKQCIDELRLLITEHNSRYSKEDREYLDDTHGFDHMIRVFNHCKEGIESYNKSIHRHHDGISSHLGILIKLAGLLHDIDDRKYFPNSLDYDNARYILSKITGFTQQDIDIIIKMISWVSSSNNGDRIPVELIGNDIHIYLIPRYADRLDALGYYGLYRTLHYTLKVGDMLFNEHTLKAKTREELFDNVATLERYGNYVGKNKSDTMIDHFYDKLLRASYFPIDNQYFDEQCTIMREPMIKVALYFGTHDITQEELKEYINEMIKDLI